jgi:GT2 family glycosyltransferase
MASRGPASGVGFGTPPQRPAVSAIIPLYRNLDFLRFQLAAFAIDPAFAGGRAELIFVLDSPEQREMVEHILTGLHGLYGLPMRLVVMPRNYGYAAANNAGAGFARGERLLFLNSDVVPERPGWLETLDRAVIRDPAVAAAGAKLLFDDDSLQHAGLYFGRDWRGRWINRHFHKGLPRRFPAACRARSVPAVTGACLLMRRAVFEAVGGFTEDYIIGDYEDSDLCLKARAAGWDIVYEPAAELYHLERQSIEQHTGYSRGVASEYNCWLHGKRWGGVIARLMGEEAAEPDRADGVRDGGDWDGAAGTALTRAVA